MQYVIYKLVQPSHLKEIEPDGYSQKTIYRDVLQKLDIFGIESEHNSMDSAISEIREHSKKLKNSTLTILPIIQVAWDGDVF